MAIMRKLMEARWLRSLFFQNRLDAKDAFIPKTRRAAFHQQLFERGKVPPWILSHKQCLDFWDVPAGQENVPNRPEEYAQGPTAIMRYVLDFISPYVKPNESLLEVGCNAGCKMNQFYLAGYTDISGLELNPGCFPVFKEYYPQLHERAVLHQGAAEDVLPRLETGGYSLVYSISSLSVVHPSQNRVFAEMARVADKHILTLEIEWAGGPHFFPRNYRRIFEGLGFVQIASTLITRHLCPEPELMSYRGHVMRLFRRAT